MNKNKETIQTCTFSHTILDADTQLNAETTKIDGRSTFTVCLPPCYAPKFLNDFCFTFLRLGNSYNESSVKVRLRDGNNAGEGRVEVFYNGIWGTICDDAWDLLDARVVCKMLGYERAVAAPGSASFGPGTGSILLDDVACSGAERNLAQCRYRGYPIPGDHNCIHSEDASVICSNTSKWFLEDT